MRERPKTVSIRRMVDAGRVLGVVVGLLVAGCGAGREEEASGSGNPDSGVASVSASGAGSSEDSGDDGGGDTMPKLDAGGGGGGTGSDADDSACPCGDNADLVYLLSDSAELWTYDPASNAFNQLGTFDCPGVAPLDSTFSMGVARSGTAWVMFSPSGDIYHVDVNDANACSDPGYDPGVNGFTLYGMAFVSKGPSSPCDTLYAHSFSGNVGFVEGPGAGMLGKLVDLRPTFISAIDYDGGELTGTGDGRLFAFAGANPAKLVEYDKDTGAVVETTPLTGLELTQAFAFAFWGGDFYFFTEAQELATYSKVTRLDHDGDGTLETVNANAPIRVVGAGVSTCAPVVPPG